MAKFDHRAGVESGIEGTEAQDLGFGTAGGGSIYIGAAMAQTGITIVPQLLCGWAAAEDEAALGVDPVQSAAQVAGQGRQLLRRESAAVGERLAAVDAGPETAVGEAAVGFSAADVAEEFALRDVTHEADMGGRRVDEMRAVLDAEVTAVPGTSQQRGELRRLTGEEREDGGELL